MADPMIAFTAPTVEGHICDRLRLVQLASLRGVGPMQYIVEPWPAEFSVCRIDHKIAAGWVKCLEVPGIKEEGVIVVMHHDVVIEDMDAFLALCQYVADGNCAAAGPSEYDGVSRFNENGKFYLNSALIVANPRIIGEWWDGLDEWDRVGQYENYWAMVHNHLGNLRYLDVKEGAGRIGRSSEIWSKGKHLATHLWYSLVELRTELVPGGCMTTIEGHEIEDVKGWRDEFVEHYAKEFGVDAELRRMDQDREQCGGSRGPDEDPCEDPATRVRALAGAGDGEGSVRQGDGYLPED